MTVGGCRRRRVRCLREEGALLLKDSEIVPILLAKDIDRARKFYEETPGERA